MSGINPFGFPEGHVERIVWIVVEQRRSLFVPKRFGGVADNVGVMLLSIGHNFKRPCVLAGSQIFWRTNF